ncbi:hypothetical protein ACU8KH_00399 [Lachancea thermotolerans]
MKRSASAIQTVKEIGAPRVERTPSDSTFCTTQSQRILLKFPSIEDEHVSKSLLLAAGCPNSLPFKKYATQELLLHADASNAPSECEVNAESRDYFSAQSSFIFGSNSLLRNSMLAGDFFKQATEPLNRLLEQDISLQEN